MKEIISLFFNYRGLFVANGSISKNETKVSCRSVLEEYPLFSKGILLQKDLIIKALRRTPTAKPEGIAIVPDGEVISRVLPLPPSLSQKQVISGLRHSLRGKLPGEPDDYSLNYYIPPLDSQLIFVSALPKEMVREIQNIFDQLGVTLKGIIPLSSALSAGLSPQPLGPVAFLSYGKEELDLGIAYNDFLTYSAVFRSDLIASVQSQPNPKEAFENVSRDWGVQLGRHFKAYETQLPLPINSLYLVGDWESKLGPVADLKNKLASLLGVTVSSPSLPSRYSFDSALRTSKELYWYIPAISGLMFLERTSPPFIDLQRDFTSRPPPIRFPFPIKWAAAAGVAAALLIGSFGVRTLLTKKGAPPPVVAVSPATAPSSPPPSETSEAVQGKKNLSKPKTDAPLSQAIEALAALSDNGILLQSITLEKNGLKVVGRSMEEGGIHAGLDDLSKSPQFRQVSLEEIKREKGKLTFTIFLELKKSI